MTKSKDEVTTLKIFGANNQMAEPPYVDVFSRPSLDKGHKVHLLRAKLDYVHS